MNGHVNGGMPMGASMTVMAACAMAVTMMAISVYTELPRDMGKNTPLPRAMPVSTALVAEKPQGQGSDGRAENAGGKKSQSRRHDRPNACGPGIDQQGDHEDDARHNVILKHDFPHAFADAYQEIKMADRAHVLETVGYKNRGGDKRIGMQSGEMVAAEGYDPGRQDEGAR